MTTGLLRATFTAVFLSAALVHGTPSAPPQGQAQRIVAVGDVHGSLEGLVQILQSAGLIDGQRRWTGGASRLVQTGDFTDRGVDVRGVIDLLMRLEGEARRAGGRVDVLLGNHEGMNILRDFRDVSPQAYATFADKRSEDKRRRAFEAHAAIVKKAGGTIALEAWMDAHPPGYVEYVEAMAPRGQYGRWIRARKAMLQVGDTIFMHAGLTPQTTATLDELNRGIEREIRAWDDLAEALQANKLIEPTFTLQEVVNAAQVEIGRIVLAQKTGEPLGDHVTGQFIGHLKLIPAVPTWALVDAEGPMWYRGFATLPDSEQPAFEALVARYGARRFVTGHTPQLPQARIGARFGGRVVLIDTGMLVTHFKNGQPSALEIQDGRLTAIYRTGREPIQPTQ